MHGIFCEHKFGSILSRHTRQARSIDVSVLAMEFGERPYGHGHESVDEELPATCRIEKNFVTGPVKVRKKCCIILSHAEVVIMPFMPAFMSYLVRNVQRKAGIVMLMNH